MLNHRRFRVLGAILLFTVTGTMTPANAQEPNYFQYPVRLMENRYIHSAGLSVADLPEEQVEEASSVVRAPLFNYQGRYGLPNNFSLFGAFYTNIATYQVSIGPRWNYSINRFALSVGDDIAYWFGALNQFGYDSKVNGWFNYPNISIGYKFDDLAVTLKAELILQTSVTNKQEDVEISSDYNTFNGTAVSVYLEQPLWKEHIVIIGMKMNYTKFYYPIWVTFPTFDRYFYIPEITLGYNL
jgi:hypothetical protein